MSRKRPLWKRWLFSTAGECLAWWVFRTWLVTLRYERVGEDPPPPVLYVFWHSKDFVLPYTHRKTGAGVLISQHEDGEIPSRLIRKMGLVPIRGSSTRGGIQAVRAMIRHVKEGHSVGLTPDGPRGPRFRVKPEVVKLARMLGVPVVPIGVGYSRFWQLSSWDRYEIPWPGARVVVRIGPPLSPQVLSTEDLERHLIKVNEDAENRAQNLRKG